MSWSLALAPDLGVKIIAISRSSTPFGVAAVGGWLAVSIPRSCYCTHDGPNIVLSCLCAKGISGEVAALTVSIIGHVLTDLKHRIGTITEEPRHLHSGRSGVHPAPSFPTVTHVSESVRSELLQRSCHGQSFSIPCRKLGSMTCSRQSQYATV